MSLHDPNAILFLHTDLNDHVGLDARAGRDSVPRPVANNLDMAIDKQWKLYAQSSGQGLAIQQSFVDDMIRAPTDADFNTTGVVSQMQHKVYMERFNLARQKWTCAGVLGQYTSWFADPSPSQTFFQQLEAWMEIYPVYIKDMLVFWDFFFATNNELCARVQFFANVEKALRRRFIRQTHKFPKKQKQLLQAWEKLKINVLGTENRIKYIYFMNIGVDLSTDIRHLLQNLKFNFKSTVQRILDALWLIALTPGKLTSVVIQAATRPTPLSAQLVIPSQGVPAEVFSLPASGPPRTSLIAPAFTFIDSIAPALDPASTHITQTRYPVAAGNTVAIDLRPNQMDDDHLMEPDPHNDIDIDAFVYSTDVEIDAHLQRAIKKVISKEMELLTSQTFVTSYRTSSFCVYKSSSTIVKIGDSPNFDVRCFNIPQIQPFLSEFKSWTTNAEDIPTVFQYAKTTSAPRKTMLVLNRRFNEERLCDTHMELWGVESRIECFKLMVEMVRELNSKGLRFTTRLNPGLISLYNTPNYDTRMCCNESEVLVFDTHPNDIYDITRDMRIVLRVYDPAFVTGLTNRDMMARPPLNRVQDLYAPLTAPSRLCFDYLASVIKTNPMLEIDGCLFNVSQILALQQEATHKNVYVVGRNNAHIVISNRLTSQAPGPRMAIAKRVVELMESNLLPGSGYFVPKMIHVIGSDVIFTDYTHHAFIHPSSSSPFAEDVMCSVQTRPGGLLSLSEFMKDLRWEFPEHRTVATSSAMRAIVQRLAILWCRLAARGIIVRSSATMFDNIYLHGELQFTPQLKDKELVTMQDKSGRTTQFEFSGHSNFDVYLDLGVGNQEIVQRPELPPLKRTSRSLPVLMVDVAEFVAYFSHIPIFSDFVQEYRDVLSLQAIGLALDVLRPNNVKGNHVFLDEASKKRS